MYDAEKVGRLKTLNQKQENDYALWLQAAYKTDCYLLDECLAKHRANEWFYNSFPIGNNIQWRYEVYRKIEDLGHLYRLCIPSGISGTGCGRRLSM
jgi:hypothetical protein